MFTSGIVRRSCAGFAFAILAPVAWLACTSEAIAATARFNQPLGEIRGTSPAQLSFDGKGWISLGSGTFPVFDKTLVRARTGAVALTLFDGSRLEASPTTELAIGVEGSSTNVHIVEGNVLFRLRPSSSTRLAMPGGFVQTAVIATGDASHTAAIRVSTDSQAQRDALGVIMIKKGGVSRIRLLSGETFLISQNGSVTERLREGQVRTMSTQSSRAVPFKQYAAAQPGGQQSPPPTDPPTQAPTPENVWTWHPSHPQDVQGGWQEMKLGVPPAAPPPPAQEVREGFAWAWKDQWVIAKRQCGQFAPFRRASSEETAQLPPPVNPPSQAAKAEHVWAWHPSNPPEVWGGWQEVQLGSPPAEPPRPDQELYRDFAWAWEQSPEKRWVVVEECGLAAAFLVVPAGSGIGAALLGGTAGAAAVGVPVGLSGGGSSSVASNCVPCPTASNCAH